MNMHEFFTFFVYSSTTCSWLNCMLLEKNGKKQKAVGLCNCVTAFVSLEHCGVFPAVKAVVESSLLYCHVTCSAALQTSRLGSYLKQGSDVDRFIWKVIMEGNVRSGLRLARNFVLFFPMRENTLSSSALLCGKVRISCASLTRL